MMTRVLIAAISLALGSLCSACDGVVVAPVSAACSQIGSQCQLPGGPLGVCQQLDCPPGSTPPCFKCVSQH